MIAFYVHPKNSNHLRSHLRARALDHSRLGLENNSWKTNQAEFFAFDKFTLQNLANKSGCVKNNLLYFLYLTSEVKQYYEALFLLYRPQAKCSVSQFFKTNCTHSMFRTTEPSKHAWAFSETVQKISKITNTASRFSLLTSVKFAVLFKELSFNIKENLVCLFFI